MQPATSPKPETTPPGGEPLKGEKAAATSPAPHSSRSTHRPKSPKKKVADIDNNEAATAQTAQRLLIDLERRLKACEELVGVIGGAERVDEGDVPTLKPLLQPLEGKEAEEMRERPQAGDSWRLELRTELARGPLAQRMRQLQRYTDQVVHGKVAEFERRYKAMQAWLEAEDASVSQVMLSLEAKKTYLLAHEARLRETAAQLKMLEDLRQYANTGSLAELPLYSQRIADLERSGQVLSEKAIRFSLDLQALAIEYNSAMNAIGALLQEWMSIARPDGAKMAAP